jgi:Xaa-Pro aminopeptidase
MWNQNQINLHILASKKLNQIKDETFDYIRKNKENTSEFEIQQFILKRFKELGLKPDKDPPIVAFNENSAIPHYFPTERSKILAPNSLILIDIWGKLKKKNAPFSDITWVAYYGDKVPDEISKAFNTITNARDSCINFIKLNLGEKRVASLRNSDLSTRNIIISEGYEKNLRHKTGHAIGTTSCHGRYKSLHHKNSGNLLNNLGYTIEPGLYIPNKFGIRSEIDFYIDEKFNMIITTPVQKEIVKIN